MTRRAAEQASQKSPASAGSGDRRF